MAAPPSWPHLNLLASQRLGGALGFNIWVWGRHKTFSPHYSAILNVWSLEGQLWLQQPHKCAPFCTGWGGRNRDHSGNLRHLELEGGALESLQPDQGISPEHQGSKNWDISKCCAWAQHDPRTLCVYINTSPPTSPPLTPRMPGLLNQ